MAKICQNMKKSLDQLTLIPFLHGIPKTRKPGLWVPYLSLICNMHATNIEPIKSLSQKGSAHQDDILFAKRIRTHRGICLLFMKEVANYGSFQKKTQHKKTKQLKHLFKKNCMNERGLTVLIEGNEVLQDNQHHFLVPLPYLNVVTNCLIFQQSSVKLVKRVGDNNI